MDDVERLQMTECQLRPSGVTDPDVVAAVSAVPRSPFVESPDYQEQAYLDIDIPINDSKPPRMMLAAATLALLLQESHLPREGKALAIGCGLGYSLAVLAGLGLEAEGLESFKPLVDRSPFAFDKAGLKAHKVHYGALDQALQGRLFNVILIEGSVGEIPDGIKSMLEDKGLLICFEELKGLAQAVSYRYFGGKLNRTPLFEVAAPRLEEFNKVEAFSF